MPRFFKQKIIVKEKLHNITDFIGVYDDYISGTALESKNNGGLSILLSISFNLKGISIVEIPKDAIDLFFECELEYIDIDYHIIFKNIQYNEVH